MATDASDRTLLFEQLAGSSDKMYEDDWETSDLSGTKGVTLEQLEEMMKKGGGGSLILTGNTVTHGEFVEQRGHPLMGRAMSVSTALTQMDGTSNEQRQLSSVLAGVIFSNMQPDRKVVEIAGEKCTISGMLCIDEMIELVNKKRAELLSPYLDQESRLLQNNIAIYAYEKKTSNQPCPYQHGGRALYVSGFLCDQDHTSICKSPVNCDCPIVHRVKLTERYHHDAYHSLIQCEHKHFQDCYKKAKKTSKNKAEELRYDFTFNGEKIDPEICLNFKDCNEFPCHCERKQKASDYLRYGTALYIHGKEKYSIKGDDKIMFKKRRKKPRMVLNKDVVYLPFCLNMHVFVKAVYKRCCNYLEKKTNLNERLAKIENVYKSRTLEELIKLEESGEENSTIRQIALVRAIGGKMDVCAVCEDIYEGKDYLTHSQTKRHQESLYKSTQLARLRRKLGIKPVRPPDNQPEEPENVDANGVRYNKELVDFIAHFTNPPADNDEPDNINPQQLPSNRAIQRKLETHMSSHDPLSTNKGRNVFLSRCSNCKKYSNLTRECCAQIGFPAFYCVACLQHLGFLS